MTPDPRADALAQEIWRAGVITSRLRLEVLGLMGLLLIASGGNGCGSIRSTSTTTAFDLKVQYAQPVLFWFAVVGAVAALPYAGAYRRLCRFQFRRRLRALPRDQQVAVLERLRTVEQRDTRRLVAPLLRELGLSTELTPAAPPEARGDEVSPPDT